MSREASYVAVYDVTSDRERNRVAKVLEGFGHRVQMSAFELRLTPASKKSLVQRLEALHLETGFVFLYRRGGGKDRVGIGRVPEDPLADERHAWVITPQD
ncbi:MAG TPA: CRISPR-associated endonuclease Cas2 [Verrucomicrobiae bacterium]|nr:CRISPR-associated endonuclease Cas2 [Verrucomicrobiae bacterium]